MDALPATEEPIEPKKGRSPEEPPEIMLILLYYLNLFSIC